MAIIGLQQQQTEVGRIRMGAEKPNPRTPGRKLTTFRFTSPRKTLIEQIAAKYGGKVEPWQPPKGSAQWQVVTDTAEVPVLIPPQDPGESQWYEMWSKGGCLRRCDGQQEKISKQACLCDPADRDCKMHTRLRVMLEDIPGLGAWRVDTGSYYAAVELPGVAQLLAMAQGAIPGRLFLDQRTVTRQVDGQPQTFNFAVPTLDVDELTPKQLMSGRVQELVAARNNAAVAGDLRVAIAATVDYPSLIDAAKNVDALYEVANQIKQQHNDSIPDDLLAVLNAKRDAFKGAQPTEQVVVVQPSDISRPGDDVDKLWEQILAESPWNSGEELETNFCQIVGKPSCDATADDMRKFLAALAKAKAAA